MMFSQRKLAGPLPGAGRSDEDETWLHRLIHVGIICLIVGMAVMPAGASYNPGRIYQYLLGLTLYLPATALLIWRPGTWLTVWRQPLMPWVVLLLAWGSISLAWSNVEHPLDELARNVSILLFLYGWMQSMASRKGRISRLLLGSGIVFALAAIAAMVRFHLSPPVDGRLIGFGVMANSNLAAAAMAAGILWLANWQFPTFGLRATQALAIFILTLFIVFTNTRSAWAAAFAAVLVFVLCAHSKYRWWWASGLVALGLLGMVVGMPELVDRGWSMRPQIFMQSWDLFIQHPWMGFGQGADFQIVAGGVVQVHTHNLFSQLAVELGLPGLVLWSGIWLGLGWRGWRHRAEPLGRLILATWVFAMIAVQFDLPHLLDSPRPDWLITWLPLALSFSLKTKTAASSTAESGALA